MIGAIAGILVVGIAVAIGASRLGYSGLIWFVAMIFGGPFTLGLVSALPDRKLERKRSSELANLRLELAKALPAPASETAVSGETIGDQLTRRS